jgi:ankyrin repeat protein
VPIVRDDVNVNINASGQTPLSWAAENGHEAVVKLLKCYRGTAVTGTRHQAEHKIYMN